MFGLHPANDACKRMNLAGIECLGIGSSKVHERINFYLGPFTLTTGNWRLATGNLHQVTPPSASSLD